MSNESNATKGSLTPNTPLSEALGARDAQAVQKAFGFQTVEQMLTHIPRRYLDVGELTAVRDLPLGEDVTVAARVIHAHQRRMHRRKGFLLEIEVESEQDGGLMPMTFFNGYVAAQQLTPGTRAVSGRVCGAARRPWRRQDGAGTGRGRRAGRDGRHEPNVYHRAGIRYAASPAAL